MNCYRELTKTGKITFVKPESKMKVSKKEKDPRVDVCLNCGRPANRCHGCERMKRSGV